MIYGIISGVHCLNFTENIANFKGHQCHSIQDEGLGDNRVKKEPSLAFLRDKENPAKV